MVVELDGSIHDLQPGHDRLREAILRGRGLAVLRFTNDEVFQDVGKAAARIAAVCLERRAELAASPPQPPSL